MNQNRQGMRAWRGGKNPEKHTGCRAPNTHLRGFHHKSGKIGWQTFSSFLHIFPHHLIEFFTANLVVSVGQNENKGKTPTGRLQAEKRTFWGTFQRADKSHAGVFRQYLSRNNDIRNIAYKLHRPACRQHGGKGRFLCGENRVLSFFGSPF